MAVVYLHMGITSIKSIEDGGTLYINLDYLPSS